MRQSPFGAQPQRDSMIRAPQARSTPPTARPALRGHSPCWCHTAACGPLLSQRLAHAAPAAPRVRPTGGPAALRSRYQRLRKPAGGCGRGGPSRGPAAPGEGQAAGSPRELPAAAPRADPRRDQGPWTALRRTGRHSRKRRRRSDGRRVARTGFGSGSRSRGPRRRGRRDAGPLPRRHRRFRFPARRRRRPALSRGSSPPSRRATVTHCPRRHRGARSRRRAAGSLNPTAGPAPPPRGPLGPLSNAGGAAAWPPPLAAGHGQGPAL